MSENDKKKEEGQNKPSGSESELKDLLCTKWALGAMHRGMGHYSYAVLTEAGAVVVECKIDKELAEHIVEIHNDQLSA